MWVLQICHSYYPPFLDCARQYSILFKDSPYKVLTVYLTGQENAEVVRGSYSDEVVFMGYESKQVSGLKIAAIQKIKKITKKYDFKLCIAHRVKPTYVALLGTKLPVVSIHHNYNDYSRWSRRLVVNYYKNRMLMLGVSNAVRDDLRQDLTGWNREQVQTLYNRIDVSTVQARLLDKAEARQQLSLSPNAWVIGTAGRLHHDKDYPTLLKGFAAVLPKLPAESKLVIMGRGPLETEIKDLAKQLSIDSDVKFLGHVPNGASYFKAFDVFALTSDREPFGMVLLEAMAASVPIICSDCGGGAEVVKDAGLLFPFSNIKELSDKLLLLANADNDNITDKQLSKLERQFSDSAITKDFWNKITILSDEFSLN